jgi:hypothetical protein
MVIVIIKSVPHTYIGYETTNTGAGTGYFSTPVCAVLSFILLDKGPDAMILSRSVE